MARGDAFDPPAYCPICRFELRVAEPHVCDLPIEGTPAWYDPSYEKRHMATRSQHLTGKVGDVTKAPPRIEPPRRNLGPNYDPYTIAGHKIDADHFDNMRAYYTGSTVGPSTEQRRLAPIERITVTLTRDPIPLGPASKPMGELTTHTLPTMDDFHRMLDEWYENDEFLEVYEYMDITWEEYGIVFLEGNYHPLHGRR